MLKKYRTGRSKLYDASHDKIDNGKNGDQENAGENNIEYTFQYAVLHLTQRFITQIQNGHIAHHAVPDTARKTLANIRYAMKIKQVILTIIHDREIVASLFHRQRAENMLDACLSGHKIGEAIGITQIRTLRGKGLIRFYIKIAYHLIYRGCQGTFHLLIQHLHIVAATYKNGMTTVRAFRAIVYQPMTDHHAINTQYDKEDKKIEDKEKSGRDGYSAKSHNARPDDGEGYNVFQYTQHELVGTNSTAVPSFLTRCRTGYITET